MKTENELLLYIYQDSEMAITNLTALIKCINNKDNKIKKEVEDHLKGYERFLKESTKILKKNNIELKDKGLMATMSSTMSIKKIVAKDNSDSKIADMLIKGLTMGTIDIKKKIENFKDNTDKHVLKLANELLEFQETSIENIKKYL